jgi:hypothetical protein
VFLPRFQSIAALLISKLAPTFPKSLGALFFASQDQEISPIEAFERRLLVAALRDEFEHGRDASRHRCLLLGTGPGTAEPSFYD